jgi:hypothetical protein
MAAPKGNMNACKSGTFGDALRKAIAQGDGAKLRMAAEKLLDLASEGTPWAIKELADRTDGKAFQSIELSGELALTKRAEDLTDDELATIVSANSSK